MKPTNKTTPTKQEDTPTGTKTATPNAHPPSDSSKITRATPPGKPRITEVSKPVVEIIACFASCAGFPDDLLIPKEDRGNSELIQYVFDLRDNRNGSIYKSLIARKSQGDWELPFFRLQNQNDELPLLSAIGQPWPGPSGASPDIVVAEYWDIIQAELNRWSRNLLAMASLDRDLDEGFGKYIAMLTALAEEYQHPHYPNGSKYLKFPLRP